MKARLWVLVLVFYCFCYSNSFAETTTSPTTQDLSQGTITAPYGGCPSGTTAAQVNTSNWSKQTVRWGECVNTFELTVAINQALSAAGISVDKAHYQWKYVHCFNTSNQGNGTSSNFCNNNLNNRVNQSTGEVLDGIYKDQWDQLVVDIEITDANGTVIKSETWSMDKWYLWNGQNNHSANEVVQGSVRWQVVEGNIEFYNHVDKLGTIYTPNQLGDVRFRFVGQDKGAWDGYYGPVVGDIKTWFTYRTNPCTDTALYDPSCPGYAEAYAQYEYDTNCAANPLYDAGCPGYATAYYNAQCSANPLYDAGCPGYANAYYNQQCELDPLYDSGCDGYAAAYLAQQCELNPLYDSSCSGYDAAYLAQQCSLDPLYDSSCTGHFEAQCNKNALYDVRCTGYEQAYFDQQCLLNPQYDELCPGYVAPIVPSDPTEIDDGTGTGDSVVDDVIDNDVNDLPNIIITPPEPEVIVPEVEVPEVEIDNTLPEVEIPDIEIELPDISIESIEQEVENEIEQELEIEPEVSEPETNTNNDTTTEDTTTEDTTTEDTVEENTVEEETVEEESTTEESTTEESTEESTEEESTEEESTEEESTEAEEKEKEEEKEEAKEEKEEKDEEAKEETVVAKKENKKKEITKEQKAEAKKKKMKKIIKDKLKKLAIMMGEAQSLKEQQALQQLIAALINYVPGFNEYGKYMIPGTDFYQPESIYQNKFVPENQRALRNGLASELKWNKMVDQQYEGME